MSDRDELDRDVIDGSKQMHTNMSYGLQYAIADHLHRLGYRKPRVVTTAEELDALPIGSVVLDVDGDAVQKNEYGYWVAHELGPCGPKFLTNSLGPFTVVHEASK